MRESFFPTTALNVIPDNTSLEPKCGTCGLYRTCKTKKMGVTGKGKKKILIVSEYPSKEDDAKGIQLSGHSGIGLAITLRKFGIEMRDDCWIDQSVRCRPPGNEFPSGKVIDYCRPNVLNAIKQLKPEVIILLGGLAVDSVVSWLWKDKVEGIERWAGYQIPSTKLNAWVCPTFHTGVMYDKDEPVRYAMYLKHLEAACRLSGRPYKEVPDYESKCEVELDPIKASDKIVKMLLLQSAFGVRPIIAFDYETTTLRSDGPHAEIYSCSVSDGRKSIAFPWRGQVVELMRRILANKEVLKIGWNAKFEDRWTYRKLGFPVVGWLWDGMLASHGMENASRTRKITSVKFQAFVKLGVPLWDRGVESFLKSPKDSSGDTPNRIKKLDLNTLLKYNALDSLYEYTIGMKQMKQFKKSLE